MKANLNSRKVRRYRQQLAYIYGQRCLCCGSTEALTLDHVVPRSQGGPNKLTNFQLLCAPCNVAKGDQLIDYRPWLPGSLPGGSLLSARVYSYATS